MKLQTKVSRALQEVEQRARHFCLGLVGASLALMIWLSSSIPLWVASAFAVTPLVRNSLVANVEDNEPGGFENPLGEAARSEAFRIFFRVLGLLLGVAFIVFAVIAMVYSIDAGGWWRTCVAPTGIIALGATFIYYGLTARSTIVWNRNRTAR